ncbi:hypothetical protein FACS189467_6400 [Bacteroidia bacterium]|nr:hypothetical protein FACS189467_6400 [Bacteroidia bacterium]
MDKNTVIYQLTEEDLQTEAQERIGRELTEDEVIRATDILKDGLGETMQYTYNGVFEVIIADAKCK